MHWTYKDVESLSLSVFNKLIKHLSLFPPLELMVAGYLGINYGHDAEKAKFDKEYALAKRMSKIDVEKSKAKTRLTNPDLLLKAKQKFEQMKNK